MLLKGTFLSISSLNRWNIKLGAGKDSFHLSNNTQPQKDSGGEIYCDVHCRHHSTSSSLQNGKGKPRTQLLEKSNKRALTACNHSVTFPKGKEKKKLNLPKIKSYLCLSNTKGTGYWFSPRSFFCM